MAAHQAQDQLQRLLALLLSGKDLAPYAHFSGRSEQLLPSVVDLTGFAMASLAAAGLAAAKLKYLRASLNSIPFVEVDTLLAVAAFRSEALLQPAGWTLPSPWDPVAGDYRALDGWIRLHTNYRYHRDAVLRALGLSEARRELVEQKVASLRKADVENAVVSAGGCAAVQYTRDEWENSPYGYSTKDEKPVLFDGPQIASHKIDAISAQDAPLRNIRVLDLTRVIAGPECTKFLAACGADVLRIDPPGFAEVEAVLPDMTLGKRCAFLDLKTSEGRNKFEHLVAQAHVLVCGLRSDSLHNMGLSQERLRKLNPSLIVAEVNAYGWSSQWRNRRGFDSLVQMSSGITAWGAEQMQSNKPVPMPAQALDHGAGYLLAAGVCEALSALYKTKTIYNVKSSLIGVANFLFAGTPGEINSETQEKSKFEPCLIRDESEWGPLKRVGPVPKIEGVTYGIQVPAGRLGRHSADWS